MAHVQFPLYGMGSGKREEHTLMNLPPSLAQQPPAYGTQFYVEEASLYSIAEDSREDRASEITSRAGTETPSVATPVSTRQKSLSVPSSPASSPVPAAGASGPPVLALDWGRLDMNDWGLDTDDDEEHKEFDFNSSLIGISAKPKPSRWTPPTLPHLDPEVSSSPSESTFPMSLSDDPISTKPRCSRNYCLYVSLVLVVVASIIITVSVPLLYNNDPTPRSVINGIASSASNVTNDSSAPSLAPSVAPSSAPSSAPSPSPSASPTRAPTFPPNIETQEERAVYEVLESCSANNLDEITGDKSTVQQQVFKQLAFELEKDSTLGGEEILERWAIILLFLKARGEMWYDSPSWFLVDEDVCHWGNGKVACDAREGGKAAVTGLFLGNNNLHGDIPKELCCLPKLEMLDISGNSIGPIPACLNAMGLTVFID